ncbi:MAG: DUF2062 domain-containing protein [Acidobacteriota bacterium]
MSSPEPMVDREMQPHPVDATSEVARPDETPDRRPPRIFLRNIRGLLGDLMNEGLQPRRAAAAAFLGVFVGVVPIYGLQSLVAIGLAIVLRLNKPLTYAATFINNPFLQPFLILFSVQTGYALLHGSFINMSLSDVQAVGVAGFLWSWVLGSIVLGVALGLAAAVPVYFAFRLRSQGTSARALAERRRHVRSLFNGTKASVRLRVALKMRLDRIFDFLATADLGKGPAVDLGCGDGIALAFAWHSEPGRSLVGCDLDGSRIEAAATALAPLGARLSIADARELELSDAGLIMIIDVLQYLDASEQLRLLDRCCAALAPGGKLIFRVHELTRGGRSAVALGLDRILFKASGTGRPPVVLPAGEYRRALESAGLTVRQQQMVNRLPLAHVVFVGERASPSDETSPWTRDGSGTA